MWTKSKHEIFFQGSKTGKNLDIYCKVMTQPSWLRLFTTFFVLSNSHLIITFGSRIVVIESVHLLMNPFLNGIIFMRFYSKNSSGNLEKTLQSVKIKPILYVLVV